MMDKRRKEEKWRTARWSTVRCEGKNNKWWWKWCPRWGCWRMGCPRQHLHQLISQLTSAGSRLSAGFHPFFWCLSLTSLSPFPLKSCVTLCSSPDLSLLFQPLCQMLSGTWDASSYIFPLKALLESFLHCFADVVDPFLLRLSIYIFLYLMTVILWLRYIIKSVSLEITMAMGNISWTAHGLNIFQAKWHFCTIDPATLQRFYSFIKSVII